MDFVFCCGGAAVLKFQVLDNMPVAKWVLREYCAGHSHGGHFAVREAYDITPKGGSGQ